MHFQIKNILKNNRYYKKKIPDYVEISKTIVFRPIPVQGPSSGFWPGRPGQFFFFKIKMMSF
jgi:hypothetical protein